MAAAPAWLLLSLLAGSTVPTGALLRLRQQKRGNASSACSGRTAFKGTFDVVITWFTEDLQSSQSALHNPVALASHAPATSNDTNSRPDALVQMRIETNNEITYMLRGMDQYGMLKHVGRIFIFLDKDMVKKYGAPRNVNWHHPKVQAVYTQDVGIPGASSIYAKLATFHRIPGISEWFMYLADDILIANKFSTDLLFDGDKPRFWMNKDLYVTPPKDCPTGDWPIQEGPAHMPWLVNRCYMEEVEHEYSDSFKSVRADNSQTFSAQCTYDSWMNAHKLYSKSYDKDNHYGVVCHLGTQWSQCPIHTESDGPFAEGALEHVLEHPPVFFNLQGSGISDEYPEDSTVNHEALQWLHRTYKPSGLTH